MSSFEVAGKSTRTRKTETTSRSSAGTAGKKLWGKKGKFAVRRSKVVSCQGLEESNSKGKRKDRGGALETDMSLKPDSGLGVGIKNLYGCGLAR